jgi:hypothetical protein
LFLAFEGIKKCVLYSEKLEAYLSTGFFISNSVRPMIRCQFIQP